MNLYRLIDENGLFVEDVFFEGFPVLMETVKEETDGETVDVQRPVIDEEGNMIPDPRYIETPVPQGFHHPKWTGSEWAEGMSKEQIEESNNKPVELSPEQEEIKALKKRLDETENALLQTIDMVLMGGM